MPPAARTNADDQPLRCSVGARRLRDVLDHIEANLDGDLSVARLNRRFTFTGCGFANAESFSRAFRREHGQSPSEFRRSPTWRKWQRGRLTNLKEDVMNRDVELIEFPTTRVDAVEYLGPDEQSYGATMNLVAWRRAHGLGPDKGRTYGIHHTDPRTTLPAENRLTICVSYDGVIEANEHGVVARVIPGGRCARIRHLGSRDEIVEAAYLCDEWLPASGEQTRDFPIYFHYLNVGPDLAERAMVTDVYLPLR